MFTVITMTLFLCLSGLAMAQEKKVDATLTMSEGQVAVGIGYNWGKGVLTCQGKEYPFKVSGLSVVDIGNTKATSSGKVYNLIGAHEDMFPTLLAAAGDTTVKEDLLKGRKAGNMTYKVHLDGYNLLPALKGEAAWPRREFIYWTDDGSVAALRYDNWKITFLKQEAEGLKVWQEPFVPLRAPLLTNLRMDPFERAEHENAMGYQRWYLDRMFAIAPAGVYVGQWLQSFREFPPRQKPVSFNLDRVVETVTKGAGDKI